MAGGRRAYLRKLEALVTTKGTPYKLHVQYGGTGGSSILTFFPYPVSLHSRKVHMGAYVRVPLLPWAGGVYE